MKKLAAAFFAVITMSMTLSALEGGPVLYLRANFGGTFTDPHISDGSLKKFNPQAQKMTGLMSGLLLSGEAEGGYIFDSGRFLHLRAGHPFSALGTFAYLGVGQGNSAQKVTADTGSSTLDTFINIDFMPVIDFGLSAKAYFFRNRFAVGTGIGGRMIADTRPKYLYYTSDPSTKTSVGEIIITDEMVKKMNPVMFSLKGSLEYNIAVLQTTDVVLGWFTRYNFYQPKYLTAPAELAAAADLSSPVPDYWLNSLDFGLNAGFAFRL